jgi:hypothetical protein
MTAASSPVQAHLLLVETLLQAATEVHDQGPQCLMNSDQGFSKP